ncbi:hypothetical protein ACJX0J_010883, partial [Zea mays]
QPVRLEIKYSGIGNFDFFFSSIWRYTGANLGRENGVFNLLPFAMLTKIDQQGSLCMHLVGSAVFCLSLMHERISSLLQIFVTCTTLILFSIPIESLFASFY